MAKDPLHEAAEDAMSRAYAPYSKFQVGAAIKGENGKIYAGCNVENASYPVGNCAEASAIASMIMDGETKISEVAVIGKGEALVTPCGACRQRIREFGQPDTPVHVYGEEGLRKSYTLDQLLPDSFGPDNLE